jgi:hypothetical protein
LLVARTSQPDISNTSICLLQGKYMTELNLLKNDVLNLPCKLSRHWLKNELQKNYEISQKLYTCKHEPPHLKIKKNVSSNNAVGFRLQCNNCGSFVSAFKKDDVNQMYGWEKIQGIEQFDHELRMKFIDKVCRFRQQLNEETYKKYYSSHSIKNFENMKYKERYEEYLASDEWHDKRRLVLDRCNYICEACGINEAKQAHHLTYANIFDEYLFELIGVCLPCHKKIHTLYSDEQIFDSDGSNSQ